MKRIVTILILAAVTVASCTLTGNILIKYPIGDFLLHASGNFSTKSVDLTQEEQWVEHRDDLNSVDDIGFACRLINNSSSKATGNMYASLTAPDSSGTIAKDVILVLSGITVEAGPGTVREIEWEESYDFLADFEIVRDILLQEQFTLYFTFADNLDVEVKDMVLFISINGSP